MLFHLRSTHSCSLDFLRRPQFRTLQRITLIELKCTSMHATINSINCSIVTAWVNFMTICSLFLFHLTSTIDLLCRLQCSLVLLYKTIYKTTFSLFSIGLAFVFGVNTNTELYFLALELYDLVGNSWWESDNK